MATCPICKSAYIAMNKHLTRVHVITNISERRILLNMSSGRVNIRNAACPVSGCTYELSRLDRHIKQTHTELSDKERACVVVEAKRRTSLKLLADLRATSPTPPITCTLDLNNDCVEIVVDTPVPVSPLWGCGKPECQEKLNQAEVELARLKDKNDQLTAEIQNLRTKFQTMQRRSLSKRTSGATISSSPPLPEVVVYQEDGASIEEPGSSPQQQAAPAQTQAVAAVEEKEDDTPKPPPSSQKKAKTFCPWSNGRGRGNTMRSITLPPRMEEYLRNYRSFNEGISPSVKMKDNALSKVSRVKTFILYMADNHTRLSDWLFLGDMERLRGWFHSVETSAMKVTTAEYYLKNTFNFVRFMKETPPRSSRLTQMQMMAIARELQMQLKKIRRRVVVHQMYTKRAKVLNLPGKDDLKTCLSAAAKMIPQLLGKLPSTLQSIFITARSGALYHRFIPLSDALEKEHTYPTMSLFYGYQSAYWSCLFGHRPGVFANMTEEEVDEARLHGGQQGYLIHIKEHKTNKSFGEAQLYLNPDEFSWVERWRSIKRAVPGMGNNKYVLFTKSRCPSKSLNNCLRVAWNDMGLKGPISFTLIRTAIATYTKKSQATEARKKVADFMCHDISTADRFYVKVPDHSEARDIRSIIADCLSQDDQLPGTSMQCVSSSQLMESARIPEEEEDSRHEGEVEEKGPADRHTLACVRPCKVEISPLKKTEKRNKARLSKTIARKRLRLQAKIN